MTISEPYLNKEGFVVDVYYESGGYYFTTDYFSTFLEAKIWSEEWCEWASKVASGSVDSIYYIVQVPDTWIGPAPNAHPYSGLYVKIGHSKDVIQRLRNLQTGTYGQLIINALEPGSSSREAELHKNFAAERRQGEWFICTPELFKHIFQTWYKNKMLPPEHQGKVAELVERIRCYRVAREALGGPPAMVNPSLNEKWEGPVFIDLIYSSLAKNMK